MITPDEARALALERARQFACFEFAAVMREALRDSDPERWSVPGAKPFYVGGEDSPG